MSTVNDGIRSTIIPCLKYRDAHAAITFLCDTFGFTRQLVVPGEGDSIAHAQLTLGNGCIMLGSAKADTDFGRVLTTPEKGMPTTQAIYVVVPDADVVYQRARAAGLDIVIDIRDQDYGGRDFTCRDPEHHVWTFGTYDPFA